MPSDIFVCIGRNAMSYIVELLLIGVFSSDCVLSSMVGVWRTVDRVEIAFVKIRCLFQVKKDIQESRISSTVLWLFYKIHKLL